MLTSREVQSFHDQGFLAVRGAIDPPTLDGLRRVADEMLQRSRDVPAGGDAVFDVASGHMPGSPRVNRVNHPVVQDPAFAEIAASDRILDIVCALLGPEVKFHHSKLNMKTGGGGAEIGWHQDYAFFPHTNFDLIACGIALDDSDTGNGCLLVIPGSHQISLLDHRDARGAFVGKITDPDNAFHPERAVPVELKAGDMSIHHVMAVHGSMQNNSTRSRRLFICQYAASDAIQLDYRPPANDFSGKVLRGGSVRAARLAGPVTVPLRGAVSGNASIFKKQAEAVTPG